MHYTGIHFKLTMLSHKYEYIETPKEQFDLLNEAVKKMSTPYYGAEDFINSQIREALEKCKEWKDDEKDTKRKIRRENHIKLCSQDCFGWRNGKLWLNVQDVELKFPKLIESGTIQFFM